MDKVTLGVCILLSSFVSIVYGKCKTTHTYDVTRWPLHIDSHDNLNQYSNYYPNEQRCMWVFTNHTNHVITLRMQFFILSDWYNQCYMDYLQIYDSNGFHSPLGRYCEHEGPGFINSTGNSLFLYFETDSQYQDSGFRLEAFSAVSDNPEEPDNSDTGLSGGAIAGIVIAIIVITMSMSVLVTLLIVYRTKLVKAPRESSTGHTEPDGHVYAIPERVQTSFTENDRSQQENSRNMSIQNAAGPSNHTHHSSFTESEFDRDVDDGSLRDYRGYDLPSYIATISNNNGPSSPVRDNMMTPENGATNSRGDNRTPRQNGPSSQVRDNMMSHRNGSSNQVRNNMAPHQNAPPNPVRNYMMTQHQMSSNPMYNNRGKEGGEKVSISGHYLVPRGSHASHSHLQHQPGSSHT